MNEHKLIQISQRVCYCICAIVMIILAMTVFLLTPASTRSFAVSESPLPVAPVQSITPEVWLLPDSSKIPLSPNAEQIAYGRELIAHTSVYLGPDGKVKPISNGMNCQNCHLKSGTKPFGNNYGAVAPTYPKFRARSGSIEGVEKRVNDCIERSLNGKILDNNSPEMKAMVAYILWVGNDVPKGTSPKGSGIWDLKPIDRAADPERGLLVYNSTCFVCHGEKGQGVKWENGIEWKYPPLAGEHSYNAGAGLYRLSRFAGFVKMNMPHGTTYEKPVLTDEQAWDVAAYINSLPRPVKDISKDWPVIATKPYDHPFGPYADDFSEHQHKYGPFDPIKSAAKK